MLWFLAAYFVAGFFVSSWLLIRYETVVPPETATAVSFWLGCLIWALWPIFLMASRSFIRRHAVRDEARR